MAEVVRGAPVGLKRFVRRDEGIRAEISTGRGGYPQKPGGYPHPNRRAGQGREHIWERQRVRLAGMGGVDEWKGCAFRERESIRFMDPKHC
jgi:hypothetical protein